MNEFVFRAFIVLLFLRLVQGRDHTIQVRAEHAPVWTRQEDGIALEKAQSACEAASVLLSNNDASADDFPGYVGPQSVFYSNRTETNWSNNGWQNASCVVMPRSSEQVAQLIDIITRTGSTFAIRSGGHDFNVNHSNVGEAGVLLDLVALSETTLSPDRSTLTVGVGARWGSVYESLSGTGVSVNGGRSPDPAVGGQMLGGGIGWFSNVAGPSAASIIGAEVVLANSTILHVDNKSEPELLWALKGGGPNFGVVTSLTLQTLPYDRMWFEGRLYTPDKNEQLLDALYEYQQARPADAKTDIVYQLSINATVPQSFVGFLHLDPVEQPAAFEPFYKIQETAFTINSTFGNVAELTSHYNTPVYPEAPPSRDFVVSLPHKVDQLTYRDSYAAYVSHAEQAAAFGGIMNYGAQPVSPTFVNASLETPLGLVPVTQDWVHVTMNWKRPTDDAQAIALIQSIGGSIQSSAVRHGSDLAFRFLNDAYDGQDVFGGYGAANLARLRQIAHACDPGGVFQRLQNGGWLLSHASST